MILLVFQKNITFSFVDLLILPVNITSNILVYLLYAHVVIFVAISQICWVVVFLIKMAHLQQQLAKLQKTFSPFHFNLFYRHFINLLVDFLTDNCILGKLFFLFIIVCCPISSYFTTWTLAHASRLLDVAVPLIFVSHEMMSIFGFHFLFTKVPQQIGKSVKLLNSISGRNSLRKHRRTKSLPLNTQIRLNHCITAFNTLSQYGVTSREIGVVNLKTFTKASWYSLLQF